MISAVVIVKNEEEILKICLESIKWVDEIVIVDSGSTDKTLKIAKEYTDKIVEVSGGDFSVWRNEGTKKATGDWILHIDADERVTKALREEIFNLINNSKNAAYALNRVNIIFGEEVRYGHFWPDFVIRLVKKSNFKNWVGEVHEYMTFEGSLGYTENFLLHLTHRDLDSTLIKKTLIWSKMDAKLRFDAKHPKMTSWRFFRIFLTESFNYGIKQRGFFAGTVGVIDSMLSVFSTFLSYVRLWEMQQEKPLNEKYREIDQKLIKNDFEY